MNTKVYNYEITILNAKNEPKVYKTTRTYIAKTNSTKNKEVKQRVINFLKEHEEEINNFPEKHRIGETMKMINKEFDLKVSYTGCRSLMKKAKQAKQVGPDSERGQANENQTVENQTIENTEEA